MITVVIDTNVLLPAFAAGSPHSAIIRALQAGRLRWAVSQPILCEYEEMTVARSGAQRWRQVLRVIQLLDLVHQSIIWTNPAYQFQVIPSDPDDNKFTDCAITAHADYVITSDRDFAPLANAGYKPQPISPEEFIRQHLTGTA